MSPTETLSPGHTTLVLSSTATAILATCREIHEEAKPFVAKSINDWVVAGGIKITLKPAFDHYLSLAITVSAFLELYDVRIYHNRPAASTKEQGCVGERYHFSLHSRFTAVEEKAAMDKCTAILERQQSKCIQFTMRIPRKMREHTAAVIAKGTVDLRNTCMHCDSLAQETVPLAEADRHLHNHDHPGLDIRLLRPDEWRRDRIL
ncbi:hypothetical protein BDV95DRAFT_65164 [Massariosphaeria phaeospora]|uniref:Uncharacterized protein n=1 Tax=Massariosphaeria phaeospora TaxID=100035 RepID=A0A7C8I4H2_9PLEO|nr:hypothetical protein BDV95DRAFT_65164 [Massariosphaeria phaeospora]